jgi:pimeloyl-ACP methyl ester carboxylesterase
MSTWHADTVHANGLRIYYTRTRGDKPPLVLAHGFSDDGLCWTPITEQLAADYDVIMVDARGHGRSEGPEQGYGLTDLAIDLAGVITGLGLHKPAVLGHSMGGGTTFVMAGTYPEIPGAILIEDAGRINIAMPQTPEAQARADQMRNRLAGHPQPHHLPGAADHRRPRPRGHYHARRRSGSPGADPPVAGCSYCWSGP